MATGGRACRRKLGRFQTPVNHYPPELGWPPRHSAPVVNRRRTAPALPTYLPDVSVLAETWKNLLTLRKKVPKQVGVLDRGGFGARSLVLGFL